VEPQLIRTLQIGCYGKDVEGCKRAVYRYLNSGKAWQSFVNSAPVVRQTFGPFFRASVKEAQQRLRLPQTGAIGPRTVHELYAHHAFDALAEDMVEEYADEHRPHLVYPHPAGPGVYVGQGLHPTEGLSGNWAIDFMAPGGTAIVAPCDCVIQRTSGHDPLTGTHGRIGDIFGWSLYLQDRQGRTMYLTHMGSFVTRQIGTKYRCGQKVGTVGHWPHNPGRSHTHLGVSSPTGASEAKQRVVQISLAPKIPAL
jgi:hypothetical protein